MDIDFIACHYVISHFNCPFFDWEQELPPKTNDVLSLTRSLQSLYEIRMTQLDLWTYTAVTLGIWLEKRLNHLEMEHMTYLVFNSSQIIWIKTNRLFRVLFSLNLFLTELKWIKIQIYRLVRVEHTQPVLHNYGFAYIQIRFVHTCTKNSTWNIANLHITLFNKHKWSKM